MNVVLFLLWRLRRHHQGQKKQQNTNSYLVKPQQFLGEKDMQKETRVCANSENKMTRMGSAI